MLNKFTTMEIRWWNKAFVDKAYKVTNYGHKLWQYSLLNHQKVSFYMKLLCFRICLLSLFFTPTAVEYNSSPFKYSINLHGYKLFWETSSFNIYRFATIVVSYFHIHRCSKKKKCNVITLVARKKCNVYISIM